MRCFLSDVDGVLCVAVKSADWTEPRYTVSHYPTDGRTRVILSNLELKAEELGALEVRELFPGEYEVRTKFHRFTLSVIGGGRGLPIATTFEPVPVPKSPGGKVEWSDGRWHVTTRGGKHKTVTV